ncbi:MAG: PBP1A family penicillin-binding protein [Anaerolineae bacterium]
MHRKKVDDIPSPWDLDPEESPKASTRSIILRGVALGLLIALVAVVLPTAGALFMYAYYARTLPSPQELYERTATFKTTRLYDRDSRLLYEILDPLGGRRVLVPYQELPTVLINAAVATEDNTFFSNPGVNPLSIGKAFLENLQAGEIVRGGSTITQQVAKMLFLTPEQNYTRKIQEAILATEITRRYSKEEILEVYLNESYFGNLAYGIGAASDTYYGKAVSDLTLPEASLLVGLLQAPALYDPYIDPQAALDRRTIVLRLMLSEGYITLQQFEEASTTPMTLRPRQLDDVREAPHWVEYVRAELEARFGAETLYRGGFNVYTTLDLDLQHTAEQVTGERIAGLRERNATNAALVSMDPRTGDILAMMGSVDFSSQEIGGQVNVTTRLRQPGSSIKPLTYLAAFERGWTPSTMLMDVKQSFPDGANPPYVPVNYDGKEFGPLSVRDALAGSRNIPAVATLNEVGLPSFLEVARRLGIQSLTRPDYGLSLTLGGGEVTLLEMTGAFAAFANEGYRVEPRSILYITDQAGKVVVPATEPALTRVIDPRHAYWISDILSNNEARSRVFGPDSFLKLSYPAAVKTGTSNDYRDGWAIGYAPDLVTGVWVGNNDNSPTDRLDGSRGAAPIWHDFMERTLAGTPRPGFERPAGLVDVQICPVSGQRHTEHCPQAMSATFLVEQMPEECQVHRPVDICEVSGQLATENCPRDTVVQRTYEDYGPEWDAWAQALGINTPPRDSCSVHSEPMRIEIKAASPAAPGILTLVGSAEISGFSHYYVVYGVGIEPTQWARITDNIASPVRDGLLARWDASLMAEGDYVLRLVVVTAEGRAYESRAVVRILPGAPTLTPTATTTPTMTPTASLTPTSTATPTHEVTATPTLSEPTATSTLEIAVPTPTATPVLEAEPTATATPDVTAETPPIPSP